MHNDEQADSEHFILEALDLEDEVPTIRSLAARAGVNPATMHRAVGGADGMRLLLRRHADRLLWVDSQQCPEVRTRPGVSALHWLSLVAMRHSDWFGVLVGPLDPDLTIHQYLQGRFARDAASTWARLVGWVMTRPPDAKLEEWASRAAHDIDCSEPFEPPQQPWVVAESGPLYEATLPAQRASNLADAVRAVGQMIIVGAPEPDILDLARSVAALPHSAGAVGGSMGGKRIWVHRLFRGSTYEEMVEGVLPRKDGSLTVTDGVFKDACRAAGRNPQELHVLVLLGAGECELRHVFGDTIVLLDQQARNKEVISLPLSGDSFAVPENLRIIASVPQGFRSEPEIARRFAIHEWTSTIEPLVGGRPTPGEVESGTFEGSAGWCLTGGIPGSDAFLLDPEDALKLIAERPDSAEVLRPFWRGRDVATAAGSRQPAAYALDFDAVDDASAQFPELFELLRSRSNDERQSDRWWSWRSVRRQLRRDLGGGDHAVVRPIWANSHVFAVVPARDRFDQSLRVFPFRRWPFGDGDSVSDADCPWLLLGVLQSDVHRAWVRFLTDGESRGRRYSAGVFESFPLPQPSSPVAQEVVAAAKRFCEARDDLVAAEVATAVQISRASRSTGILKPVWGALDDLNQAVSAAYGWYRFPAESEALDRLLEIQRARLESGRPDESADEESWEEARKAMAAAVSRCSTLLLDDVRTARGEEWRSDRLLVRLRRSEPKNLRNRCAEAAASGRAAKAKGFRGSVALVLATPDATDLANRIRDGGFGPDDRDLDLCVCVGPDGIEVVVGSDAAARLARRLLPGSPVSKTKG